MGGCELPIGGGISNCLGGKDVGCIEATDGGSPEFKYGCSAGCWSKTNEYLHIWNEDL